MLDVGCYILRGYAVVDLFLEGRLYCLTVRLGAGGLDFLCPLFFACMGVREETA